MGLFGGEGGIFGGIPILGDIEKGIENTIRALHGEFRSREQEAAANKRKLEAQRKQREQERTAARLRREEERARKQNLTQPDRKVQNYPYPPTGPLGDTERLATISGLIGEGAQRYLQAKRAEKQQSTANVGGAAAPASLPRPAPIPARTFTPVPTVSMTRQLSDIVSFANSLRSAVDVLKSGELQGATSSPLLDILRQQGFYNERR